MGAGDQAEAHASLEIRNKKGLHLRAARLLVDALEPFDAEVTIEKDGQVVNGRSIMGVMMLAAEQGSHIEVTTTGPDAQAALDAITDLVANKFNESE